MSACWRWKGEEGKASGRGTHWSSSERLRYDLEMSFSVADLVTFKNESVGAGAVSGSVGGRVTRRRRLGRLTEVGALALGRLERRDDVEDLTVQLWLAVRRWGAAGGDELVLVGPRERAGSRAGTGSAQATGLRAGSRVRVGEDCDSSAADNKRRDLHHPGSKWCEVNQTPRGGTAAHGTVSAGAGCSSRHLASRFRGLGSFRRLSGTIGSKT